MTTETIKDAIETRAEHVASVKGKEEVVEPFVFDLQEARLEFSKVLSSLELFSPLFYQLVEIGLPEFIDATPQIYTAGVGFDKEGHYLSFVWAKEFWAELTFYQRVFVASHECLHVYLSHGKRIGQLSQPQVANIAADIVVNEMLVSNFGFDQNLLGELEGELVWLDKYFPDDEEYYDRTMEWYYDRLLDQVRQAIKDGKLTQGSSGPGQGGGMVIYPDEEFKDLFGKTIDHHEGLKEFSDKIEDQLRDKVSDTVNDEEKKNFKEQIDSDEKDADPNEPKTANSARGNVGGSICKKVKKVRPKYNYKWSDIIKFWRIKNTKPEEYEEIWHFPNRRIKELPSGMFLPVEHDGNLEGEGNKIDVWFFMDTSYSCVDCADSFFACAKTFPVDRFDIRPFCFDTQVYDIDLEKGELFGFGGTSFDIIEDRIQEILKKEHKKYPNAVFVFTDGYGNNVKPDKSDRWHWFLTENNSKDCIPKTSHTYNLKDFKK